MICCLLMEVYIYIFIFLSKEVTPVQYTVALEGHDPDPTFVDTPSGNDLTKPLGQAGAAPCGCSPKLAGTLKLKGATDSKEKQKITNAIADAFAKQNQGTECFIYMYVLSLN